MAKNNKNQEILQRIATLKEKHLSGEDGGIISEWEKTLRNAIAQSDLMGRPEIQKIVQDGQSKIESINAILQNDEALTETERKDLFRLKAVHSFYLERFIPNLTNTKAEQIIARLDGMIAKANEE